MAAAEARSGPFQPPPLPLTAGRMAVIPHLLLQGCPGHSFTWSPAFGPLSNPADLSLRSPSSISPPRGLGEAQA